MKADAQSSREKEALDWAVDQLRASHHLLTPAWSKEQFDETIRLVRLDGEFGGEAHFGNWPIMGWSGSDEEISKHVKRARGGDEQSHRVLLEVAASRVKRDLPLGNPLTEYAVEFLREQKKPKPRGPKRSNYMDRDLVITVTIWKIGVKWGFSPTRNPATDSPSAISIVQKALKEVGFPMTEAAITKIWRRWK
jgi:hypothetical protein